MSNIRRLLLVLALLAPAASAQYFAYNGQCAKGGQEVLVQNQPSKGTVPIGGSVRSLTSGVVASYPSCIVTVFLTGTQNLAVLFQNSSGGALTNPFTANTDGSFLFFTSTGSYDITLTGAGIPTPTPTLTGVPIGPTGSGPPGSLSVSTNGVTNGSQTLLNFANGANMSIVDNGQGTDTFSVAGVITGATSNSGLIQTASTLGLYPCPNGQILKSIGTNWACSAFLSGPVIQTNGTNNVVQTLLNLQPGSGITITDNGSGTDTFTASGAGFTGSGTPNFLTKFTGTFAIGNSAISEATGSSPAVDQNGFDAGTTGGFSGDIANDTSAGTVTNALACPNGTNQEVVCPAASSTTNVPDGTCIGNCSTSGNGTIVYLGIILNFFDNQSVPGDWAVASTTANGYLHDTGNTFITPGQSNFHVRTANAGANTLGYYSRLSPIEIAAAATSISFTVNGGSPLGSPVNCVNGIGTTCLNASGNNFEVDVAPIPQAVTVTADPTPGLSNNGEFYQLNPSGAINFTLPASIPSGQWAVVASNISAFTVTIRGNGNNVCALTCASTLAIPAGGQYYVASSSGEYVASLVPSASTPNALTMNNSGSGAASGATFNGAAAVTLSYNTLGAAPLADLYQLQVGGTNLTLGDTVNLNNTTPAAGSNGKNISFQTSNSGGTDSVSGEIVGDGTSTHFLNGTGTYTTPAGAVSSITGDGTIISNSSSTGAVTLTLANTVTGTGGVVLANTPTLITPVIGVATGTSLLVTGILDGKAPVTLTTGASCTLGTASGCNATKYLSGYTFNQEGTPGTAITYTLPTAAAGLQYCVANSSNYTNPTTGTLEILTSASGQFIVFTDGTLSATGGFVQSGGAAGDAACVVGLDATHWQLYVQAGTWVKH